MDGREMGVGWEREHERWEGFWELDGREMGVGWERGSETDGRGPNYD